MFNKIRKKKKKKRMKLRICFFIWNKGNKVRLTRRLRIGKD
jgi:hypothetical protein